MLLSPCQRQVQNSERYIRELKRQFPAIAAQNQLPNSSKRDLRQRQDLPRSAPTESREHNGFTQNIIDNFIENNCSPACESMP